MGKEQALEVFIGNAAGLWEAIHAFPDFHIYVSVADKVVEIVVVHDCVGNGRDRDAHVGVISWWHGCAKVKIFEVAYQALRTRCGDDAVEKQFCSDYVSCFGADIPEVFNLVGRYVACLPFGIAETGMKNMVLVPGIVSLPWARRWISVALADRQRSPSELWLSSLYSASSPVSGLKAFPWSAMKWMHR